MSKNREVDHYIRQFPESVGERLMVLRRLAMGADPNIVERFSYGMPAYNLNGKPLIYIAGYSKHIGIYATPEANRQFAKQLLDFKTGRGSIQLPHDKPLPISLIKKIILFKQKSILSATSKQIK